MPALPSLNALRAFEASGRHLNFRLAAEELGVSHGAVAQQVRGLEARLGTRLFDRTTRGLRLTDQGRRILAPLSKSFRRIENAVADLDGRAQRLRISVPPSFAAKWLVPRMPGFLKAHPEIDVQVEASEGLANFQADGVDIAVRQGMAPFGTGLVADPLFTFECVAVCAPDLIPKPRPISEALAGHLLLDDAHGLWSLLLDKIDVAERPRTLNFNQTSLAIDAALNGQGIALANRNLVERELATGRLVQPFADTLTSDLGFYVVVARHPRQPELTGLMRDWLLSMSDSGTGNFGVAPASEPD